MSTVKWLKVHRIRLCPPCSKERIVDSLYAITAWCNSCKRVWRLKRDLQTNVMDWNYLENLNGANVEIPTKRSISGVD